MVSPEQLVPLEEVDSLYEGVIKMLGRYIDNEEAVGMTLLIAYEKRHQFRGNTIPQYFAWCKAIAKNEVTADYRKYARFDRYQDGTAIPLRPVEETVEERYEVQRLYQWVEQLNDIQHHAIIRTLQGCSPSDIAAEAGVETNTVYKRLHDAREKLTKISLKKIK